MDSLETSAQGASRRSVLQSLLATGAIAGSGLIGSGLIHPAAAAEAVPKVNAKTINRQWILKSRPNGPISMDNYEYRETPLGDVQLKDGEVLVRHLLWTINPATRVAIGGGSGATVGMPLGKVVGSGGVSQVVMSKSPKFPVGSLLTAGGGWQDYSVVDTSKMTDGPLPKGVDPTDVLGIYGGNAQTAYFGMIDIGEPKPGDIVVVSGASGSVGQIACQIARIKGAKVIGIAGGAQKCADIMKDYKLYGTIDYKSEKVADKLKTLAPNGVNVYYDNVGGTIMQDVVDQLAPHARVVLCGTISSYNSANPAPGPRDMLAIVTKEIKMQGFELPSFMARRNEAIMALKKWHDEGQLTSKVDVREGFKNLPKTLELLFSGEKEGTLIAKNDAAA